MKLIPLDAVVAEIEKVISGLRRNCNPNPLGNMQECMAAAEIEALKLIKDSLDSLDVKEVEEHKQPEYSCLKTVYWCGKKPHWNIGDVLAYYESYSDREGECVLGKVTKVEFDEEQCDWFYTVEDGSVYDEQSLLEDQTYKKN